MTLMARYSATCPNCGEKWQPGDLIRACSWPQENGLACWHHAVCPDLLLTKHGICNVCFLAHPEGKCDR